MIFKLFFLRKLRTVWYNISFIKQLRLKNLHLPMSTIIIGPLHLYNKGGHIYIGKNVTLRSTQKGYHGGMPFNTTIFADGKDSLIEIGDSSKINGAYIHSRKRISIGKNCLIAAGVNILDANGHELLSNNRPNGKADNPKDIIIKDNVWIGLNAIILKGTIIGNNCVVGANSVVKGVFDDNTLIQGNPAIAISQLPINAPNTK